MWSRFLARLAEGPAIARLTTRTRFVLLPISNPNGFPLECEIVCLNFLKTDLYLTLIQENWKRSYLRFNLRFLICFLLVFSFSFSSLVKLKVNDNSTVLETVTLKTF